MFSQKLVLAVLFFAAFTVNAQTAFKSSPIASNASEMYVGLSNLSEFAEGSETSSMEVHMTDETIDTNFMRVDYESETLADDLNAMHFKRRSGMEKTGRILRLS